MSWKRLLGTFKEVRLKYRFINEYRTVWGVMMPGSGGLHHAAHPNRIKAVRDYKLPRRITSRPSVVTPIARNGSLLSPIQLGLGH